MSLEPSAMIYDYAFEFKKGDVKKQHPSFDGIDEEKSANLRIFLQNNCLNNTFEGLYTNIYISRQTGNDFLHPHNI